MADREHLRLIRQGAESWNQWRQHHRDIRPDLSSARLAGVNMLGADLSLVNLSHSDLTGADLTEADLYMASLYQATLVGARLRHAQLVWANLTEADLTSADLHRADMTRADAIRANFDSADLSEASLERADLTEANLTGVDLTWAALVKANLVEAVLEGANLTETLVYGVAAWNIKGTPARQRALVISRSGEHEVTVDNIEVAQFIYLLLNNEKIRSVIDIVTSKVVLILGRFTDPRKMVLDRLRDELHHRDLVPVLFDFTGPASKDVTATIETLARMARFIIADLTDPSSVPHELAVVIPMLRTTPVVPLRLAGTTGYSMFDDFRAYPWVLPVHEYQNLEQLMGGFESDVLLPAEHKRRELTEGISRG